MLMPVECASFAHRANSAAKQQEQGRERQDNHRKHLIDRVDTPRPSRGFGAPGCESIFGRTGALRRLRIPQLSARNRVLA